MSCLESKTLKNALTETHLLLSLTLQIMLHHQRHFALSVHCRTKRDFALSLNLSATEIMDHLTVKELFSGAAMEKLLIFLSRGRWYQREYVNQH